MRNAEEDGGVGRKTEKTEIWDDRSKRGGEEFNTEGTEVGHGGARRSGRMSWTIPLLRGSLCLLGVLRVEPGR